MRHEQIIAATKRLVELQEKATPGPFEVWRYDHGGGRCVAGDGDDLTLIADYYQEGDREFHFAARNYDFAAVLRLLKSMGGESNE